MIGIVENSAYADELFKELKTSLVYRIEKLIKKKKFILDGEPINLHENELAVLKSMNNERVLQWLITISPLEMKKMVGNLHAGASEYINRTTPMHKTLYRIFKMDGYDEIDKLSFIKRIDIDTCPYCNRNYIYYLDKDKKIKPQLDHFYPVDIYPIFAASYFNLIPSCQTCNGFDGKTNIDPHLEQMINPYLIKPSDFKFTYEYSLAKHYPLSAKSTVDISFTKSNVGNVKAFKLDELYKLHGDHVLELIIKSKMKYSPKYRAYLKYKYHGFKFNEGELDRLILGNFSKDDELHKRPLSKLYSDIGRKLGLITDL